MVGGRGGQSQGQSTCREATICSSVQQVVSGCSCPSRCTQARGQEPPCQTASHWFYIFFSSAFLHQCARKIWAEVTSILAPVWAPSQVPADESPHWHCYSDHSSIGKDAGCAHAWLSLGPNLLSILQGSNHNNSRPAKSKEVGGLFIRLNKPLLNAQITAAGSEPLQRQSRVQGLTFPLKMWCDRGERQTEVSKLIQCVCTNIKLWITNNLIKGKLVLQLLCAFTQVEERNECTLSTYIHSEK